MKTSENRTNQTRIKDLRISKGETTLTKRSMRFDVVSGKVRQLGNDVY